MNIGICGHQNLGKGEIIEWLKQAFVGELRKLQVSKAFSNLAIGADQVFAEIIVDMEIPLSAIIPCFLYEETFDKDHIGQFKHLLSQASEILQLDFPQPSEKAFFEGGKTIVKKCDMLFAAWDGRPAKGLGGTGDVVQFALELKKPVIHLDVSSCIVNFLHPQS